MEKGVKILLILVIVILITIPTIILFSYFNNKKACVEMFTQQMIVALKNSKCLSLCPTELKNGEEQIDISCMIYCRKYLNDFPPNIPCEVRSMEMDIFLNDWMECRRGNKDDIEFQKCAGELTSKYSYIVDVSDMQLEPYQRYDVSIERLDCDIYPLEIDIKLNEGIDDLGIMFVINRFSSTYLMDYDSEFKAPSVGQTKTYKLEYNKTRLFANVSEVAIALVINGTIETQIDSKSC